MAAQSDYQKQLSASKPNSSDLSKPSYASTMTGSLPTAKRRRSPFDRIGSQQWQPGKGQVSNSYA